MSFLPLGKPECTHQYHTVLFSTSVSSCVSSLDVNAESLCPHFPDREAATQVTGGDIYMVDLDQMESR